MSGHSKWKTIKHRKGLNDARRGKLWSKLARNIIVATKSGGGDPANNLSLRYAIDKAKEANMPSDTIDKAIKRGTGELGGAQYVPAVYEGYGPGGVAFIVDALTDNPNRTAPEIKKIFERGGGNLGATNCVSWNFSTRGLFTVSAADIDEETLMEIALEAGADDVARDGEIFEVSCAPTAYDTVQKALQARSVPIQHCEITKVPGSTIKVNAKIGERVLKLVDAFEEHDDVQHVYSNFDLPEEVMAQMG
jgi:YebC/PmpR family DNA-binding regulatory protein